MSRFAQITYASLPRTDGTGGGQRIKDTAGSPEEAELRLMQRNVVDGLDYHAVLPRTAADAAAIPARLRYRAATDAAPAIWAYGSHAGADPYGRPENVYSHVIVDRTGGGDLRPIDMWFSGCFARPFGIEAILSTPAPVEPAPGLGADGYALAAGALSAEGYREQLLAAADALARVRADATAGGSAAGSSGATGGSACGTRLVLVTDRQDWAATIIAALSYTMVPAAAAQISFSLYARAHELDGDGLRGVDIVTLPEADLPALAERSDVLVLGDGVLPQRGPAGEHLSSGLPPIPATAYSALLEQALAAGSGELRGLLGGLTDLGHEVPAGAAPAPAWGLAVLLAEHQAGAASAPVTRVLSAAVPAGAVHVPRLHAVHLAAVRTSCGTTIAEAQSAPPTADPGLCTVRDEVLLERILDDPLWLFAHEAPALGFDAWRSLETGLLQAALEAIQRLGETVETMAGGRDAAAGVFRLAGLIVDSGVAGLCAVADPDGAPLPEAPDATAEAVDALQGQLVYLLSMPQAVRTAGSGSGDLQHLAPFSARLANFVTAALSDFVSHHLQTASAEAGIAVPGGVVAQVAPAMTERLLSHGLPAAAEAAITGPADEFDPVSANLAILALDRGMSTELIGDFLVRLALRGRAVSGLPDERRSVYPLLPGWVRDRVARLDIDAAALARCESEAPGWLPTEVLLARLNRLPFDEALAGVCTLVCRTRRQSRAAVFARLLLTAYRHPAPGFDPRWSLPILAEVHGLVTPPHTSAHTAALAPELAAWLASAACGRLSAELGRIASADDADAARNLLHGRFPQLSDEALTTLAAALPAGPADGGSARIIETLGYQSAAAHVEGLGILSALGLLATDLDPGLLSGTEYALLHAPGDPIGRALAALAASVPAATLDDSFTAIAQAADDIAYTRQEAAKDAIKAAKKERRTIRRKDTDQAVKTVRSLLETAGARQAAAVAPPRPVERPMP
jgi:hypothetical protein